MVNITVHCAICGEQRLTASQVFLIAYGALPPEHVMWRCPSCDEPHAYALRWAVVTQLLRVKVRVVRIQVEHPTGVLDSDYRIDLGLDLEKL